jgi:hypothetical protein
MIVNSSGRYLPRRKLCMIIKAPSPEPRAPSPEHPHLRRACPDGAPLAAAH